jgi:hypothetical protein
VSGLGGRDAGVLDCICWSRLKLCLAVAELSGCFRHVLVVFHDPDPGKSELQHSRGQYVLLVPPKFCCGLYEEGLPE